MSMRTILGVLVMAAVVVGCGSAASTPAPATPGASPSPSGAFGGTVTHGPHRATTTIDAVANGASVSGTAITTVPEGTHTVRLGCVAQDEGGWVLGGTTEKSTIPGEPVGTWSAVIVKAGTPQQIGIWLSADPSDASDCAAWVASIKAADIPPEEFSPVDSGSLVPPPVAP
jgi:hypothetical protein